jgi:hypothetical protein
MATIDEIQNFLNIEIGERWLRDGKKDPNKNKYYYYEGQYYIVQLTQNKWMICEDCNKTRLLLRLYSWCVGSTGYATTSVNGKAKNWHRIILNYEAGLLADHINRMRYDNRIDNLRIVTYSINSRNITKPKDNTSGTKGVRLDCIHRYRYWKAEIVNNEGIKLKKCFSINKLGDDRAKELAIAQRRIWEQEYGYIGD